MRWGHVFVTTNFPDTPARLNCDQMRTLHRHGHVIGSHTGSHPERISHCPYGQLRDEWRRGLAVLAEMVGRPVVTASVPSGYYARKVARAAAKAGVRARFPFQPTPHCWRVEGCLVFGRYSIQQGVSAAAAAAIAAGEALPCLRQQLWWVSKRKILKVRGNACISICASSSCSSASAADRRLR